MAKSVYLSPSTQADNVGKGNYGTEEIRMNQIANDVAYHLNRHGLTVYRNDPSMSLRQVVDHSNSIKPDVHFAIHSNAGGGRGCEVFCYKLGQIGERLALNIYNELAPITPTGDRGVKQGFNYYGPGKHMYEVTYTNAVAALVEVDFHDSIDGANFIVNNLQKIAIALSKGLLKNMGIAYVSPIATPSLNMYRVLCGSFKDKNKAVERMEALNISGFNACIVTEG